MASSIQRMASSEKASAAGSPSSMNSLAASSAAGAVAHVFTERLPSTQRTRWSCSIASPTRALSSKRCRAPGVGA